LRTGGIRRLFHALDASGRFAAPAGELSVALLDAAAMGRLHARFMDDPSPTDVMTFDGDRDLGTAGEICVCVDVAASYAASHGGEFEAELTLYLVHGYLHLAGFDDHTTPQRRRMRAAERRALDVVRRAGAMPGFALA
jgi:probable rRNA maturation factor